MAFIDEPATITISPAVPARGSLVFSEPAALSVAFAVSGDIFQPTVTEEARALNSTRVRIVFSAGMDNNSQLRDRANYAIQRVGISPVAVNVLEVVVPNVPSPAFVDLVVSEMTNGGSYQAVVNPGSPANPATSQGIPIPADPQSFTGIGIVPTLALAIATSETQAEVRFSENMKNTGAIALPGTYSFDNGLTVLSVLSVSGNVVTLLTSEQDPDLLYTLTVDGVLSDGANNPLAVPTATPMIGFQPGEPSDPARIQRIYNFIIQTIRDEDQTKGDQLLERYLEGPQNSWEIITSIILSIPTLWDVTKIPDAFLPFMKNIVGWTVQLDSITDALDSPTLRRLVANSVAFWKRRGTETSTDNILTLVTGARVKVLNWFDFRFVVGEAQIGLEGEPNESWTIPFLADGASPGDEYLYVIRIVDDETLNRQLVTDLAILTRPLGERVEIDYLALLDQFNVDSDNSQWDANLIVADGVGTLSNSGGGTTATVMTLARALVWSSYTTVVRARQRPLNAATESSVDYIVYRAGADDSYGVRITIQDDGSGGTYAMFKEVASVETILASGALPVPAYTDVFLALQIDAVPNGNNTEVSLSVDGVFVDSFIDGDQAQGTIAVEARTDSEVDLDTIEVFFNPLQRSFIDIGDVVTNFNFDL